MVQTGTLADSALRVDNRDEDARVGHIRLGRLPKSKLWEEVVAMLDRQPEDIPGIAAAVLDASAVALELGTTIASASRAFLVLLELAQASGLGAR